MKPIKSWQKELLRQAPGEPSGGTAEPPAADPPPQSAPDTSFLPEGVLKDGAVDYTALKAHMDGLAPKAVAPDAYDFSLPADFKVEGLPEGVTLELNAADEKYAPMLAEVSDALKGIAAPPEVAQKLMGAFAKYEAAMYAAEAAQIAKETEALGPQSQQRIETLNRALETKLPADQATAIKAMTKNAAAVQALEALLSGQSFTSPPPNPKTAQDDLDAYYKTPKK